MSKFVAAVVAMKLVEDGILSLDAPVDAKLKMWNLARPLSRMTVPSRCAGS
jgi:CubicO group peptidase (beta-lactamase class C family)